MPGLLLHRSSFTVLLFCISITAFLLPKTARAHKDDLAECPCQISSVPDLWDKALTARWMVHSLDWGVLSTISSRLGDKEAHSSLAIPFGNVYSFVDGPCDKGTGIPYFYGTYMDQSFIDSLDNDNASFTLSEATLSSVCIDSAATDTSKGHHVGVRQKACQVGMKHGDPENPVCARLTLTGKLVEVADPKEKDWALKAIFERHDSMKDWPANHDWVVAKLDLKDIWLIDYFGGATILDLDDYFNVDSKEVMMGGDEDKH